MMIEITFNSNDYDDEDLIEVQYALFKELNAIDGVNVAHPSAEPAAGERGALHTIGVVLKSVIPGAMTQVAEALKVRLSSMPEIDLDINGMKLSTRNLGAEEFTSILAEALRKEK